MTGEGRKTKGKKKKGKEKEKGRTHQRKALLERVEIIDIQYNLICILVYQVIIL